MKVAVSGATGFIGRHVVAALDRRGLSPTLWLRQGAVAPAPWAGRDTVYIDLHEPPCDAYARLGRPDVLLHLAWAGLPNYRSLHHFEQELPSQYRLLKQLIADGLPSLVVTGTCFEYGAQFGPLAESLPCRPDNPYGFAKDVLRQQLQYLQSQPATPAFELTWARLFYLHGDGQAPNSLLPQLRRAVAAGDETFPMSGGEQLRDFMAVEDAAEALVRLAVDGRGNHGIVNVCSGQPVAVRRLVERWIESNRWTIRPELGRFPYPAHEPMAFWGDATRLHLLIDAR